MHRHTMAPAMGALPYAPHACMLHDGCATLVAARVGAPMTWRTTKPSTITAPAQPSVRTISIQLVRNCTKKPSRKSSSQHQQTRAHLQSQTAYGITGRYSIQRHIMAFQARSPRPDRPELAKVIRRLEPAVVKISDRSRSAAQRPPWPSRPTTFSGVGYFVSSIGRVASLIPGARLDSSLFVVRHKLKLGDRFSPRIPAIYSSS